MVKYFLPFILTACGVAPITPADAFELEVEPNQWDHVWNAIEYLKRQEREKKMTSPSDAINSALTEFEYGSDDPTESEELLQLSSNGD